MRALVVDDSNINLKVTERILTTLGFDVDLVNSGKDCLEIVKNNNYDLILMDIMMPEMDGVECFKKLRSASYTMPIVALTADVVDGAEEKYLSYGFDGYIPKPIEIALLKSILTKLNLL